MPECVPGISFADGVCSYCTRYKGEKYLSEGELKQVVSQCQQEKHDYDCVVPISGGRDSSFVLYVARAVLGMKALAVNYDNEFQTGQARVNIQRACERLGVDLVRVRSRRDIARRIVRSHTRFALPQGLLPIVGGLCTACAYGYRSAAYRAAETYRVPLILWGESQAEATHHMLEKAKRALPSKDGGKLRGLLRFLRPSYYRMNYCELLQRMEFPVTGNRVLRGGPITLQTPGVREIRLFDYILWDRDRIKQTITKELGWEKPPDRASTWRIDCHLTPLVNYCYFRAFGCSKGCFGYCNMINSGQMTREEALTQEEQAAATYSEGVKELLANQVGLRETEISRFLLLDA